MDVIPIASTRAPSWSLPSLRGCVLCVHGEREGTVCLNRECGGPVPTNEARDLGGPCGPEAKHLYFAGL